jgi:methylase of polypeptide subunit release factors
VSIYEVRAQLQQQVWTVEGVAEELGPTGESALSREDLVALGRREHSPLTRLFLVGAAVPDARRWDPWVSLGLVQRSAGEVRAAYEVRPHPLLDGAPGWVVADLSPPQLPGPLAQDHVTGVGPASLQLLAATPRADLARAWDLGTGCGVQALHLTGHCSQVVATDVSARALSHTRLGHGLSGLRIPDLRPGSFAAPVAGDTFDLVVGNPPFVVGPPRTGLTYRDAAAGDEVSSTVVTEVARHLAPGGVAVLMASWQHGPEPSWADRVAAWIPPGIDAWVVQRSVLDPAEHTALWLRDGGDTPSAEETLAWLGWFDATGVQAVGYGLIVLHQPSSAGAASVLLADDPAQLRGGEVTAWARWCQWQRTHELEDLLPLPLALESELRLEQSLQLQEGGWTPQTSWLTDGRRHLEVDAAAAAILAGCDGTRPLSVILAMAELAHGVPVAQALSAMPELLRTGRLLLPEDVSTGPLGTRG